MQGHHRSCNITKTSTNFVVQVDRRKVHEELEYRKI